MRLQGRALVAVAIGNLTAMSCGQAGDSERGSIPAWGAADDSSVPSDLGALPGAADDASVPPDSNVLPGEADDGVVPPDAPPGEAVIEFLYRPHADAALSAFRHTTTEASFLFDHAGLMCPPGWALRVPVEHPDIAESFAVHLWFHDTSPEVAQMHVGTGEMYAVGVDIPRIEHGGRAASAGDAPMHITETTGKATSGWYAGDAVVETAFYSSDAVPSGEQFVIRRVEFRDVHTYSDFKNSDLRPPACSEGEQPTTEDCAATYDGRCFSTKEAACQHGCGTSTCDWLESRPPQAVCPT